MRPPLEILHREINGKLDPKLYPYKPRSIPFHIKDKAKSLLNNLESQGFIRKLGPEEASDFFFTGRVSSKNIWEIKVCSELHSPEQICSDTANCKHQIFFI